MKQEFYLILPNIRSCHNVGAMFRTADACGVDKLFLVGYTPSPPKPQIDKVALGAEQWVPWESVNDLDNLLKNLQQQGVFVVALEKNETSQDMSGYIFPKDRPVALLVGNEVDGVSPSILERCDAVVHIPMHGKKESLNVSIAAGIAMYEIRRQR